MESAARDCRDQRREEVGGGIDTEVWDRIVDVEELDN